MTTNNSGFPAGTRILTDKGLVPIENIKVGDMVLSKSEDNLTKAEFKNILKINSYENKEIYNLIYVELKTTAKLNELTPIKLNQMGLKVRYHGINAIVSQQFWVHEKGWIPMDCLQYGDIIQSNQDGIIYMVFSVSKLMATNLSNIVAVSSIRNILEAYRQGEDRDDLDYYTFNRYGDNGHLLESLNDGTDSTSPLTIDGYPTIEVLNETYKNTVYNLELADNQTYYIWDLWVKA